MSEEKFGAGFDPDESLWDRVKCPACGKMVVRDDAHTCNPSAAPSPLREPSETPEAWLIVDRNGKRVGEPQPTRRAADILVREWNEGEQSYDLSDAPYSLVPLYRRSALPVDTPPRVTEAMVEAGVQAIWARWKAGTEGSTFNVSQCRDGVRLALTAALQSLPVDTPPVWDGRRTEINCPPTHYVPNAREAK